MQYNCSCSFSAPHPYGPIYCIGSETWEIRVFVALSDKELQKQIQVIINRCFEERFNLIFLYTDDPAWKSQCDVVFCNHPTNTVCTAHQVSTDISRFITIAYPQSSQVRTVDILHTIGHVLGLPCLPSDFWLQYPDQDKFSKQTSVHRDNFEDSVMRIHSDGIKSCWRQAPLLQDLCKFDVQTLRSLYGPKTSTGASIENLGHFYVFTNIEN